MENLRKLAVLVKEARLAADLSQTEAGQKTGFGQRTVSDIESGRHTESLPEYAFRLGMELDAFELLQQVVDCMFGVPLAGTPLPDGVVQTPEAMRDLVNAMDAKFHAVAQSVRSWIPIEQQRETVQAVALRLLDTLRARYWMYGVWCRWAGLDPDRLMLEHQATGVTV